MTEIIKFCPNNFMPFFAVERTDKSFDLQMRVNFRQKPACEKKFDAIEKNFMDLDKKKLGLIFLELNFEISAMAINGQFMF